MEAAKKDSHPIRLIRAAPKDVFETNTKEVIIWSRGEDRVRKPAVQIRYHPWSPDKGFRYDGLYSITDKKCLDVSTNLWTFKLERCPNQDPIRVHGSVGERPAKADTDRASYAKSGTRRESVSERRQRREEFNEQVAKKRRMG